MGLVMQVDRTETIRRRREYIDDRKRGRTQIEALQFAHISRTTAWEIDRRLGFSNKKPKKAKPPPVRLNRPPAPGDVPGEDAPPPEGRVFARSAFTEPRSTYDEAVAAGEAPETSEQLAARLHSGLNALEASLSSSVNLEPQGARATSGDPHRPSWRDLRALSLALQTRAGTTVRRIETLDGRGLYPYLAPDSEVLMHTRRG
jgi:hypothetical protein